MEKEKIERAKYLLEKKVRIEDNMYRLQRCVEEVGNTSPIAGLQALLGSIKCLLGHEEFAVLLGKDLHDSVTKVLENAIAQYRSDIEIINKELEEL